MVECRKACKKDAERIYALVQETIRAIYPRYYPAAVVDFFAALHNLEHIAADIESGAVWALWAGTRLLGTGSRREDHITRLFVLPSEQGKGYGSFLLQGLEAEIAAQYDRALLDASLPAVCLYERRGYRSVRHETLDVEGGAVLVYEVMEKQLDR